MTAPRSVLVEAIIERPPPLPWVGDLPVPEPVASWPGTLLSWRWLDKDAGLWVGMVRYRRDGLLYEHAVNGELLNVLPDSAVDNAGASAGSTPRDVTGFDATRSGA